MNNRDHSYLDYQYEPTNARTSAAKTLRAAGLDLADTLRLTNAQLLEIPGLGWRQLCWIREETPRWRSGESDESIADTLGLPVRAVRDLRSAARRCKRLERALRDAAPDHAALLPDPPEDPGWTNEQLLAALEEIDAG